MTTLEAGPAVVPRRALGRRGPFLPRWTVPVAAALAVLARIPFLGHAPGPDESGFLLVGAQWHGAGTSLYGNYFVDRPPLLVTIFQLADSLGGIPALRVLGCLAVIAVVVGCAQVAALVGGEQAGRWAAVTAAALCVSPLLGGYTVNGELLAAPFVVSGIIAVVRSLRSVDPRIGIGWMVVGGAMAMCAVLVKQNFADVAVFGVVALVVSIVRSEISLRRFVSLAAAALLGASAVLVMAAVWTAAHGTSLRGVFDAMFPFRLQASRVIAAGGRAHAWARLVRLIGVASASGLSILMLLVGIDALRRRRLGALGWGLLALLVFAVASALLGGNFWHHYLIGLIVPVSITTGVLVADRRGLARLLVVYVAVAAILAWAGTLAGPKGSEGETVGTAIAASAGSRDTIVNLYGHPDIVQTAGLASPYEHLWSLPAKTLDPKLTQLDTVLSGPRAPTWLVTGPTVRSWGLQTSATADLIVRRYRDVATICGHSIYLHDGVDRPVPRPRTTCRGTSPGASTKEPKS